MVLCLLLLYDGGPMKRWSVRCSKKRRRGTVPVSLRINKMIIDMHTHTFPDTIAAKTVEALSRVSHSRPFSDGSNAGLIKNMRRCGIDRSVILPVATAPRQVSHVNDAAAAVNEKFRADGLFSFGCIHPDHPDFRAELARVKDLGLKGIKIHPVYQGAEIDSPKFLRIIERAAELDLIVITHAGLDIGYPGEVCCSPRMCRRVVDEIGPFRFVLAHMGGWRNWEDVPKYLKDTQAYIDTSFSTGMIPGEEGFYKKEDLPMLDQEGFMRILDAFGCERVLLGSDSPWSDQAASLEWIRALPLSDSQKEAVSGGNAERLLHLR